ncbi:MAG: gamma-glutamylcyclotransferase family protein [Gammaproteobacteria bacterium]
MSAYGAARRLFVYGTLMFSEVFAAVCGVRPAGQAATVQGYARRRVRDAIYPALVECAGARTDGLLLDDIDAAQWRQLDAFEGALYERVTVQVERDADGLRVAAQTYVAAPQSRHHVLDEPWQLPAFDSRELAGYLE